MGGRHAEEPMGDLGLVTDFSNPLTCHLGVCLVVELLDLACDSDERDDRSRARVTDLRGESLLVNWLGSDVYPRT
jgi:hypothetical protein